jgi:hypothetical protein
MFNLCELLLFELRITNDLDVLEELESLIVRLLDIAENSRSYLVLCETYILQAKLSLIRFKLKKAQLFLTQAQKLAEKFSLTHLEKKISCEYDSLLNHLTVWENFKEKNVSLPERIEFAQISEQLRLMVQNRILDTPDISSEDPVILLIVSDGGRPIFSQLFAENHSFEDHLFGGFVTAINSFIKEKFSEGLDRATFGEYTLILESISPFFMCYIFKGQSYYAQKRIRYFIDKIQNDEPVWRTITKFYKRNKEIQLKDIPSLEPLINEIFIAKNVSLT